MALENAFGIAALEMTAMAGSMFSFLTRPPVNRAERYPKCTTLQSDSGRSVIVSEPWATMQTDDLLNNTEQTCFRNWYIVASAVILPFFYASFDPRGAGVESGLLRLTQAYPYFQIETAWRSCLKNMPIAVAPLASWLRSRRPVSKREIVRCRINMAWSTMFSSDSTTVSICNPRLGLAFTPLV